MNKLTEIKSKGIFHGNIFRLPARWPYEEWIDFMVFDSVNEERPHGLMVSSGYKAGLILVLLPAESILQEMKCLSTDWVIENWSKWIYPECDVNDVYVIDRYEAVAP